VPALWVLLLLMMLQVSLVPAMLTALMETKPWMTGRAYRCSCGFLAMDWRRCRFHTNLFSLRSKRD
jgi:hypothetical protein